MWIDGVEGNKLNEIFRRFEGVVSNLITRLDNFPCGSSMASILQILTLKIEQNCLSKIWKSQFGSFTCVVHYQAGFALKL